MTQTQVNQEEPRALLTIYEVCERLQLSRPTVTGLIKSGKLRCIRFGRAYRIPTQALEAFIAGQLAGNDRGEA